MNVEHFSMGLILHAGNAKSFLHEALHDARNGNFEPVDAKVQHASAELLEAHKLQTQFIQEDANDGMERLPVIVVHAQDHLMTVMSEKDLIKEMIEIYRKQFNMNLKIEQLMEAVK
ncbi:PTS lactose/cellobiose transporter subunit IIA [Virgibacillus oceani]|uniref:PTS mannose transporter subunit IIA n=1 Tax=Virgibacillus oceani TaxID=1479511 RepID=A0A917M9C9_9BACI|nr:PTS lactose/cellobiose transporter subunit IIA [Virgibacillus oceani]GGG85929.1 PTS mannose transporter subunit IIA [Virgibacillus oceani]